jgi:hypothetical protein
MGWLSTIGRREARGELRAVYDELGRRPMPAVYRLAEGDTPNIIAVHGPDPLLMRAVFRFSGTLATDDTLSWPHRELVNTVTSRLNQCFY